MSDTTMYELEQEIRDEVREEADSLMQSEYPEDSLHEMADSHVPVYNELLDLTASDNNLALSEPEVLAFDGTPTPINAIAGNVYERLLRAAFDEWEDVKAEREDDDE